MNERVAVIGGGLAGLAAAAALGERGCTVTVFESRQRLGGRASSFTDATTGQLVDACQHASMGCCTNLQDFARRCGIDHFFEEQPALWFRTADGRTSTFKADPWPAPLHLGRALLGAHYLTSREKLRIAYGLLQMLRMPAEADPPLEEWLFAHGQTRRTIDRFWAVVLVSALNETPGRSGLKYARKVFRDGFVRTRGGHVVSVPTVPLGRLYGPELREYCSSNHIVLRENAGVRSAWPSVVLRTGERESFDATVVAVPCDRVGDLLPTELTQMPFFERITRLSTAPITSVHLWYDRPVLVKPHYVIVDGLAQWVFARGESAPGEHYLQVVISASRQLAGLGREEVLRRVDAELQSLFRAGATLLRGKMVTEHSATFSAVPGVDAYRPAQTTPVPGLFLAGDYTQTGWPATMEGAVRSGYLAAEGVLQFFQRPGRVLVPDLELLPRKRR
jgi:squalene-associated FAD-dependent desaturase